MHLTDPQRRLLRIRGRARAGSERPAPAEDRTYLSGPVTVPAAAAAVVEVTAAPSGEERRRFDRVALHSELAIRRVGGFSFQVAIKNISSAGCRIEMVEPCEAGDCMITRLPQLEPLGSRVCWSEGMAAGIEFLTVIHPAVLSNVLGRLPVVGAPAE